MASQHHAQWPGASGASRRSSLLSALLQCSQETTQTFLSCLSDCTLLRLACRDGLQLVDRAVSSPFRWTFSARDPMTRTWTWTNSVLCILAKFAERWPLRSELRLTAQVDPSQDPHYLLQPFALAAQSGLQLPGVTHVILAFATPEHAWKHGNRCPYAFRHTVRRRALLQREQARVRCEGPFEPNAGWCVGCSSCRGLYGVPAAAASGPTGPATAASMEVDATGEAAGVPHQDNGAQDEEEAAVEPRAAGSAAVAGEAAGVSTVRGPASTAAAAAAVPGAGHPGKGSGAAAEGGAEGAAAAAAAASASGCSRGGRARTVGQGQLQQCQEREPEVGTQLRSKAHRAAVEVTVEEAEVEWRQNAQQCFIEGAKEAFRDTLRWLSPSGRFGQQLAQLFPNLVSLDLAGEMWLPPHSGVEANTPALQARWAALLSALRPHRLPRLRSLAGPAHLLLHPGLAELTGLEHLTLRTENELPCPLPACVYQLPRLHTLTLEDGPRMEREFNVDDYFNAGLPLHRLLPALPPSLHLLRLRNARLRLFPVRCRTSPLDVDLQLRPQLHLRVRGTDKGCGDTDPDCVIHLVRVVSAVMAAWPGYKQEQQQQQLQQGLQQHGTGGGGSGSSSSSSSGNRDPVVAGGAASALWPPACCLGSFGPDMRTPLVGLAGVEVEAIQLVAMFQGPLDRTLPLQLMEGLARRYPLTINHVRAVLMKLPVSWAVLGALVDLLLAAAGRAQLLSLCVDDIQAEDSPAMTDMVRQALRRLEAGRRLPEQVEVNGCSAELEACLEAESEGIRKALHTWVLD